MRKTRIWTPKSPGSTAKKTVSPIFPLHPSFPSMFRPPNMNTCMLRTQWTPKRKKEREKERKKKKGWHLAIVYILPNLGIIKIES